MSQGKWITVQGAKEYHPTRKSKRKDELPKGDKTDFEKLEEVKEKAAEAERKRKEQAEASAEEQQKLAAQQRLISEKRREAAERQRRLDDPELWPFVGDTLLEDLQKGISTRLASAVSDPLVLCIFRTETAIPSDGCRAVVPCHTLFPP